MLRKFAVFLLFFVCPLLAQEGIPLFTPDFPPEEFAARRAKVYDAIGSGGVALLQGAASQAGYVRFRQTNEFYYFTGIEVPHVYVLLDGSTRTTTIYLPHRNEARERVEGKVLSSEDADLVKKLSGIDAIASVDALAERLGNYARSAQARILWTPFAPSE